jgi:exodeoxyribonuclease III
VKLTTWNVNGIRAVLNKQAGEWLHLEQPDVLCLQEVKARPEQLSEEQKRWFSGYTAFWNPAQRPGYSGVATFALPSSFANPASAEVQPGLGIPYFDIEGRLIRSRHPGFTLFNIYFPSGQRDYGRVQYKLEFYAALLEKIDELHAAGEKLILCGDFNTAHCEVDLRNPRQNQKTSGFLPEERVWIDRYLNHGLVDVFRLRYPEKVQYTWWTYRAGARQNNVGWRIDYFLISESLLSDVEDVIIHDQITGSDHCPVSLQIHTQD